MRRNCLRIELFVLNEIMNGGWWRGLEHKNQAIFCCIFFLDCDTDRGWKKNRTKSIESE